MSEENASDRGRGVDQLDKGSAAGKVADVAQDDQKDDQKHDIYFMAKDKVVYKFPVNKEDGSYTEKPSQPHYSEPNLRHIYNRAHPNLTDAADERPRGPVFATLPLTAEPGPASISTCYVINPNNLNYRNAYTAEEWSWAGAMENPGPSTPEKFELIVAGPKGRIYHLRVGAGEDNAACSQLDRETLKTETDVWEQLRNGTVLGRVLFKDRIVPLLNVTSVQQEGSES
jgi:hypothetical protein